MSFNPRARGGRDLFRAWARRGWFAFQSTRPRGARPGYYVQKLRDVRRFNPRARGGRDWIASQFIGAHNRFNPRARGGRDLRAINNTPDWYVFQSTRPRGARLSNAIAIGAVVMERFNPRARGGRDLRYTRLSYL